MKLPKFHEITQDKTTPPPWADALTDGEFISYGPTFKMKTYLDLFDEYLYPCDETGDITYYVYDPIKHGAASDKKYPVLMWLHGLNNSFDAKNCIFCCGAEQYATKEYQECMGGAYIIVPLANERRLEDGSIAGSWSTFVNDTNIYSAPIKAIYDKVCQEHMDNIEGRFVMGASAGGYFTWQLLQDYTDYFIGAIPISSGYVPTDEELLRIEKADVKVLVAHGRYDELASFDECIEPRTKMFHALSNVDCYFPKWVQNGDKGISSIHYGFEMGQHCMINQIQANLIFDDKTPMSDDFPEGITGWIRDVVHRQAV